MPRTYDRMPDLPKTVDDPKVEEFMEHYFAQSNDGKDHAGFADLFTADGEYSMNHKIAKGHDEIVRFRTSMFSHIPDRDHVPLQIYTHGHDQLQLMVRGKVTYKHHYGDDTETEWASHYELVKQGEDLKLKKVHIIVDSKAHH